MVRLNRPRDTNARSWLRRMWAENAKSLKYCIIFTGIGLLMLQCSKYLSGY